MQTFAIYCKSYRNDLERVKVLIQSTEEFNQDNIPVYVSCPTTDYELFKTTLPTNTNIVKDEDITGIYYDQTWHTQQIVKAQFWKLGVCDNYLVIDSDSYFIKPFKLSDFMYNADIPYTVMHEQKELFSWTSTRKAVLGFNPKDGFATDRQKIMDLFERGGRLYDFGPSPVIWSKQVWTDLEFNYLEPNNLDFEQLIQYSHSEFSWYGESLLKFQSIPIYPVEPLFKVFHYPQQLTEYYNQGITEEMIADNYLGVVMTSNFGAPLRYSNS